MTGIHPDLRRMTLLCLVLGPVFVFVGLGALGYLFHWPQNGGKLGFCLVLLYGLLMLLLGYGMFALAPRAYRRATWVFNNVQPQSMLLTLREESSSDSTELWVDLRMPAASPTSPPHESHRLNFPRWKVSALPGPSTVLVYRDPDTGQPAVLETEKGRLWAASSTHLTLPFQRRRSYNR